MLKYFTKLFLVIGVCFVVFVILFNSSTILTTNAQVGTSIMNLNFAIANVEPWMQFRGGDARFDGGLRNPLPTAPSCGGPNTMISGSSSTHGVFFSGDTSSTFGQGQVSNLNWLVGGTSYPALYSLPSAGIRRTSYEYIATTLRQSGITPIPLTSVHCSTRPIDVCILNANLPNGVYEVNGNFAITNSNYSFAADRDYVFLVTGNLSLFGNIDVPVGSTVTFAVSEDIRIASGVGSASPTCPPPANIEGFYSADNDIVFEGVNNCSVSVDFMLGLEGSFIANAGNTGGEVINERNLCAANLNFPSVSFRDRPDMILNAPDLLKVQTYTFKEIAP